MSAKAELYFPLLKKLQTFRAGKVWENLYETIDFLQVKGLLTFIRGVPDQGSVTSTRRVLEQSQHVQ